MFLIRNYISSVQVEYDPTYPDTSNVEMIYYDFLDAFYYVESDQRRVYFPLFISHLMFWCKLTKSIRWYWYSYLIRPFGILLYSGALKSRSLSYSLSFLFCMYYGHVKSMVCLPYNVTLVWEHDYLDIVTPSTSHGSVNNCLYKSLLYSLSSQRLW